jgi:chemotaxis protein MotB
MKKMNGYRIALVAGTLALGFVSCVPLKQYNEQKTKAEKFESDFKRLNDENRDLTVARNELSGKVTQLERRVAELERTVQSSEDEKRRLTDEVQRLQRFREELEKQISALKDGSSDEITTLLAELQTLQRSLQEREDRVKAAEKTLKDNETLLADAQRELAEKQESLLKLQKALDDQKQAVESLRQIVVNALKGYTNNGLTIEERNGKVYVSMDEKLLFESGSYTLGEKGKAALKDLGNVLAANPSINIMVEGHTDNVPLRGANQIKDNWDLSVMRATAVTKIILNNPSISAKRVTAAGRGEFLPIDAANTTEARQKNRRTEIILTPDLDKLFELLK